MKWKKGTHVNPTTEMLYAKDYKAKEIYQDANSGYIMAIDGIFSIPPPFYPSSQIKYSR